MYVIKICIHLYLRLPDYGDSSLRHEGGLCWWTACAVPCVRVLVYIKVTKHDARNE